MNPETPFRFESLESRTLFAGGLISMRFLGLASRFQPVAISAPVTIAPVSSTTSTVTTTAPTPSSSVLAGAITGKYIRDSANTSVVSIYSFSGSGTVTPIGSARISGSLQLQGPSSAGTTQGRLMLVGAKGTVMVLLAPVSPGGTAPGTTSLQLTYTISGGTGAFQNLSGSGHLSITLQPVTTHRITQSGKFTMAFSA